VQNRQNLDRGLISQKSSDLFARFLKYPGITNYFLTDNSWTGSTSPWTGRARLVHRGPTPARTTGTVARSPELGLRPLRCAKARRRGRKTERGGTGSSSRASPGLERRRGGQVTTGKARWCRRSVRGRLELGEREMIAGKGAVKLKEVARLL
jgi:hypothetical protein